MALVSIIVLTFNSEDHIKACLQSIESQTHKKHEVILVDAGSTDKTLKYIDEFKDKLSIMTFNFPNSTMGQARNIGIKNASGRLIAFLDSDDVYLPNKLEKQVKFANSIIDPKFVVFSNHYNFFLGDKTDKVFIPRDNTNFMSNYFHEVLVWQGCNLSSMLIKHDPEDPVFFNDGEGGRFGEDWQYNIELHSKGYKFSHCEGIYSIVNVRPDSHTSLKIQYLMVYYVLIKILSKRVFYKERYGVGLYWYGLILPHILKFVLSKPLCDNLKDYRLKKKSLGNSIFIKTVFFICSLFLPFLNRKIILWGLSVKRNKYAKKK